MNAATPTLIDPRGPRFGAAITAALLLVATYFALVGTSANSGFTEFTIAQRVSEPGFIVMLVVALLFAWSLLSPRTQPIHTFFRVLVQPRLAPPTELEDARPPRFAQAVGLVVVALGILLHFVGVPVALVLAGAVAFIAAALNATIGWCLGCEMYLLLMRAGILGRSTR